LEACDLNFMIDCKNQGMTSRDREIFESGFTSSHDDYYLLLKGRTKNFYIQNNNAALQHHF
jgi:hypothetical protein